MKSRTLLSAFLGSMMLAMTGSAFAETPATGGSDMPGSTPAASVSSESKPLTTHKKKKKAKKKATSATVPAASSTTPQ